ncbi:hypothetical protein V8359_14650 [Roseovarius sp. E0-M6]
MTEQPNLWLTPLEALTMPIEQLALKALGEAENPVSSRLQLRN